MFDAVTKSNLKLYAASVYDNPGCISHKEFEEDYGRVKSLKTLLNKHIKNKQPNVRIIINHIICIANVFPGNATSLILFTDFDRSIWNVLATFLFYLNLMPEAPFKVNGSFISINELSIEENLLERLRTL